MNGELTDEAIEEGRIAILNLEKELKERANDAVSTGSNKHHSSTTDERRILDQMPREARLNNRLESLGLTVEELDDRGLLDGGGSVPSYVTSLKNKSRRTLELQSRSHRLQGRDKETFTKLLNSFLHMIRTLVRKGLNLDVYCRRHDPNRRGLMRKKAFFNMLKTIGLPFTGRELQDITLHYIVPASDQADYVSLLKDARIVNLGSISNAAAYDQERSQLVQDDTGADETAKSVANMAAEPDTGISSPTHEPVRGDMELSVHTLVLADVRRMLLESIRSLSKDQDDVYRMFARWDTNGTGTVTATQFLRVLARLHVDLSDQDQDFLVELLDTNGMGRIDFEGLIAFCFASTPETDILSPVGLLSGGGSLSVGEDNVNNETMSAVSTEGNTSVDKSYNNGSSGGINSRRPHTATLSRPYNEHMSHAHSTAHTSGNAPHPYAPQTQTYYHHHNLTLEDQHQRGVHHNRPNTRGIQRPLTASGRVSSTQDHTLSPSNTAQGPLGGRYFPDHGGVGNDKHIKTQSLVMEYGHSDRAANMCSDTQPTLKNKASNNPVPRAPQSSQQVKNLSLPKQQHGQRGPEGEDSQYVVELPDDVMYGEEKYLGSDSARARPTGYNSSTSQIAPKQEDGNAYSQHPPARHMPNGISNPTPNHNISNHYFNPAQPRGDSPSMEMQELHEMGSFNDNTLVTDQEEYFFGSPKEIPTLNNTRNLVNSMNNMNNMSNNMNIGNNTHTWAGQAQSGSNTSSNDYYGHTSREFDNGGTFGRIWREPDTSMMSKSNSNSNINNNNNGNANSSITAQGQYAQFNNNNYPNTAHPHSAHNPPSATHSTSYNTSSPASAEPIEHLVLLATQILSTLREIIMGRYRRGRSLQEIYEHFDRTEKSYFDASDFVTATADLRIETSARVAAIAINMIALDGYDKVSFGEFKVFVLDSDHKLLELNVQEQLAQMLEQKGREYQSFMADMFWNEEESLNDSRVSAAGRAYRQNEFVSKIAFVSSLQRIGLVLTSSELNRLVDRFDVHGNEMCSVPRFVRMVQNSRAWRHGEKVLAYQDEALEEGDYLRRHLQNRANGGNGSGNPHEISLPDLPEELISMCEYLGIRVLSEPNMVWIAADALKAPLPVSWTAQKDSNGRTYFYNHLNNQTKLEHPLDPHFRKLRDKYRQGGSNEIDLDNSGGRGTSALPTNNNNNNNTTSAATKNANSAISFGGMGAALNPPPLNQSLVGQARPQPPPNSFQHLYTHANGEHHFPVIGTGNASNNNQNVQNVSPSMRMMQDEDEVLYVKYGNMGSNSNPQTAQSSPGTGYGQQPSQQNNANALRTTGSRRPQSALDRTQFSAQQQQQAPRGRDSAQPSAAGTTQSALPSGFSAGIYSAELKALMGSAAYNRPVSAPLNHHVQAEKLNAYTDASNRMRDNTKEEHKKNTMELLEAVYTNYPKPLPRASSSGNAPVNTNYGNSNTSGVPSGMGSRSGSAKWANSTPVSTTNTPLSVVDRAMSIGRSSTNAYQPSRAEQQVYASYNNYPNGQHQSQSNSHTGHSGGQPRERSRSANRAAHRVPLDNHTKQARLSEMYDEAILDKLDTAIGIRR